jgi:hypothetical protein
VDLDALDDPMLAALFACADPTDVSNGARYPPPGGYAPISPARSSSTSPRPTRLRRRTIRLGSPYLSFCSRSLAPLTSETIVPRPWPKPIGPAGCCG